MTAATGSTQITLDELDTAIRQILVSAYYNSDIARSHNIDRVNGTVEKLARHLVQHVLNNREPDWQRNDVTMDAEGIWYVRVERVDLNGKPRYGWRMFGCEDFIEHHEPKRPMIWKGKHG